MKTNSNIFHETEKLKHSNQFIAYSFHLIHLLHLASVSFIFLSIKSMKFGMKRIKE